MRDTYQTATAKVLARTEYGTRVEVAKQSGWILGWSNNGRRWGRYHRSVKRGEEVKLDANEILLYGPARYIDNIAKQLPYLPLYQYSTEAGLRGPLGPGGPLDPERFTSNPGKPGPEEEWLGGEESEEAHDWDDPTHSPYEGDIPPWGQQGYEGEFPMESRVFYVNAYTQLMKDRPFGSFNDNLQKFGTRHWVGTVRQELQMGADFDYVPFAAIPIRKEDAKRKDYFFTYLGNLSKALNLQFTHIVVQKTFPTANFNQRTSMYEGEVKFEDGRWFPYVMDPQFSHPEVAYMNAYVTNRLYGGPEEGGWWYDTGKPIAAIPFMKKWGVGVENKWNDYLVLTAGWESKFKLGSVLGRDNFRVGYEDQFPSDYPKERPHYE